MRHALRGNQWYSVLITFLKEHAAERSSQAPYWRRGSSQAPRPYLAAVTTSSRSWLEAVRTDSREETAVIQRRVASRWWKITDSDSLGQGLDVSQAKHPSTCISL